MVGEGGSVAERVIIEVDFNRGRLCHACRSPLAVGDKVRRAAIAPGYFVDGPKVASEEHVVCAADSAMTDNS
jgi:hypothetical protein